MMQIYSDRYFSDPEHIVEIFEPDSLHDGLDRIEKLQQEGYHLLGYMRYDLQKPHPSGMPLLYFEAYRKETDKSDAESRIAEKNADDEFPAGIFTVPLITREEYENKISYCCIKCNFDVCYKCYYKIDSQENNGDEDDNDNDKDNDDNSFDKGVNKVLKTYKAVGKVINEIDECANQ